MKFYKSNAGHTVTAVFTDQRQFIKITVKEKYTNIMFGESELQCEDAAEGKEISFEAIHAGLVPESDNLTRLRHQLLSDIISYIELKMNKHEAD